MTDTVRSAQSHNAQEFAERGPGLRYSYKQYVLARRPSTGEILLGGLGAMGVGEMWFPERPDYESYPGYNEAEVM